jgi:hypothetical protein
MNKWIILLSLSLLLGSCGRQFSMPDYHEVIGTYFLSIDATSSAGLEMTLYLNEDYTAEMEYDYLNEEPPVLETGTWIINSDGLISVKFTETGGVAMYPVVSIDFAFDGRTLESESWDVSVYGSEGLTFDRI